MISFWTRDQAHVPCIGRWIFNPWTTREVPEVFCFQQEKNYFWTQTFEDKIGKKGLGKGKYRQSSTSKWKDVFMIIKWLCVAGGSEQEQEIRGRKERQGKIAEEAARVGSGKV